MDNELKQIFTRRLSQCNRGEMIVIIYDIYFAYEKDICDAFSASDYDAFKASIHKAQDTLQELMADLRNMHQTTNPIPETYKCTVWHNRLYRSFDHRTRYKHRNTTIALLRLTLSRNYLTRENQLFLFFVNGYHAYFYIPSNPRIRILNIIGSNL